MFISLVREVFFAKYHYKVQFLYFEYNIFKHVQYLKTPLACKCNVNVNKSTGGIKSIGFEWPRNQSPLLFKYCDETIPVNADADNRKYKSKLSTVCKVSITHLHHSIGDFLHHLELQIISANVDFSSNNASSIDTLVPVSTLLESYQVISFEVSILLNLETIHVHFFCKPKNNGNNNRPMHYEEEVKGFIDYPRENVHGIMTIPKLEQKIELKFAFSKMTRMKQMLFKQLNEKRICDISIKTAN